ncbi:MAG: hypothetical protein ACR2PR_08890 [Pseudohongiellaceae bacterium]
MHIYQIRMTKSVTKQVQQFEPQKVEVEMTAQLDENDKYDHCVNVLVAACDNAIAAGFGRKAPPAGKVEQKVEKIEAPKSEPVAAEAAKEAPKRERGKPAPGRKRRTKEEVEEDRLADETQAAAGEPDDSQADPDPVSTQADDGAAEIPEDVTDDMLMAATNRAVKHLKPAGVRKVMEGFKVKRLSELSKDDRMPYLMGVQTALKDMGVNLNLS